MKSQGVSQEFYLEPQSREQVLIDYKRLAYRVIRFWYFIVLSVAGALVLAFFANRYSAKIYPITASVIVKEAEDFSGAELLYNNPLVNYKRNYLNEIYIIKSYPLVRQVVENLNLDVAFYREGNILTTETYQQLPIQAIPIRDSIFTQGSFEFKVVNGNEFKLLFSNESEKDARTFRFGDTISYHGFKGLFNLNDSGKVASLIDDPLIFSYSRSIDIVKHYVESLTAKWAEVGAGVVNISINGSNPAKETDFLGGLIAQYQKNDLEIKNEAASRTVDFITEQLAGISDSLSRVEQRLEHFKNKNIVTDLTGEALRLYEEIQEIEAQKAQIRINQNYYEYLIDYIKSNNDADQIILPGSVGISDPILSELVGRMNEMQLDIKMLGKTENPLVLENIQRVKSMRNDIIDAVRNQDNIGKIKVNFLNKQIKAIEGQLARLPVAERTLVSIRRSYALQENLYVYLLQKRSEAAISRASNSSDIVLVNPAMVGEQIRPKAQLNYLIAIIVGLGLPLLIFLLLELFDNRIQSRDDIAKITAIPIIGAVGHKRADHNLEVLNNSKTILAESFRALRSNLSYFLGKREKAVILVTSSISGEGKTFTSLNLASVLSLSGKRTLLVGADMRKPKLFSDFNLKDGLGLSTYLAGIHDFDDVVQETSYAGLSVISGGPIPPNPAELLLTQSMQRFIEEAKGRYDYVILDTPPLGLVTDAFILSGFADHTLFMVRQNYTPKELLKSIEDFFASGKLKDISILLNDVQKSGPGYGYAYGYGYGYGYGYYADYGIESKD